MSLGYTKSTILKGNLSPLYQNSYKADITDIITHALLATVAE
jgi:hypothetical protein